MNRKLQRPESLLEARITKMDIAHLYRVGSPEIEERLELPPRKVGLGLD